MTRLVPLLALHLVLLPTPGASQTLPPDPLWIGILGTDGAVVPFARFEAGLWTAPWPEPVYMEEALPEPGEAPATWYIFGETREEARGQAPLTVTDVVAAGAHCGTVWALATDWPEATPTPANHVRPLATVVASRPLERVDESEIPGLAQYREEAGLVSELGMGEKHRTSTALAFFRWGGEVLGLFREQLYEGEDFELHNVSGPSTKLLARMSGGGC